MVYDEDVAQSVHPDDLSINNTFDLHFFFGEKGEESAAENMLD